MKRLATYVAVNGEWYGPDDDVPAEVAKQITNPKAWESEDAKAEGDDEGEKRPPRRSSAAKK